jgi:hypothetical protein
MFWIQCTGSEKKVNQKKKKKLTHLNLLIASKSIRGGIASYGITLIF